MILGLAWATTLTAKMIVVFVLTKIPVISMILSQVQGKNPCNRRRTYGWLVLSVVYLQWFGKWAILDLNQ
jgi:hypothetical protein